MRCLILCLFVALLHADQVTVDGREVFVAAPEQVQPTAILLWLHDDRIGAKEDCAYWQRNGVVSRGVVVVCPSLRHKAWHNFQDRPLVFALLQRLRETTGLPRERVLIGGVGSGAEFAQHLALARPQDFAACLIARGGDGGRWPETEGHELPIFGIYGNVNDEHVPIKSLRAIEKRLRRLGIMVRWQSALHGEVLGAECANLMMDLIRALEIPLDQPAIGALDLAAVADPEPEPELIKPVDQPDIIVRVPPGGVGGLTPAPVPAGFPQAE